jgi:hypothetical protein
VLSGELVTPPFEKEIGPDWHPSRLKIFKAPRRRGNLLPRSEVLVMSYPTEIAFDDSSITSELEKLSLEALECILEFVLNDGSNLPFDIFLSQNTPARITGRADQVLIGFRLSLQTKRAVTA